METVHLEGYLVKRMMKSGRNWKRRYFVLQDTTLWYFRVEGDSKPRGEIQITSSTFVKVSHYKANSLELSTDRQVLIFCADSQQSQREWLHMLVKSINMARMKKNKVLNKPVVVDSHPAAANKSSSNNKLLSHNQSSNNSEDASNSFHEESKTCSSSVLTNGGLAGGILKRLKHRRRSSSGLSSATTASSVSNAEFQVRGGSSESLKDTLLEGVDQSSSQAASADTDPCATAGRTTIPNARPTHRFSTTATTFEVDTRYEFMRSIGTGAYGVVVSAKDTKAGEEVAIKKVSKAFEDLVDAKRILREIKLLRHFDHENVIHINDLVVPPSYSDFEDIYIVSELMETDLHRVIYSKQVLTEDHIQYFIYQSLRALKYIHSANVIHRDLKPSNLLLNRNCDLKICDFGLARGLEDTQLALTEYVVTRWYRAPEIMLSCRQYTKSIDVWALGCIFAELLQRKPLFPGEDYIHQLQLITDVLGTPTEKDMDFIKSERAKRFMRNQPLRCKRRFSKMFPKSCDNGLDLMDKMLQFNPAKRITVGEALTHPYLESLHQPDDEPICDRLFLFDDNKPDDQLKKRDIQDQILVEMFAFHPEDRARIQAEAAESKNRSQYI